ncbi:DHH family isoform B [Micractinium conductrix]|uniref:DHH family isoform A n=1 Tax=Micractinium conductrix TaxID=554055 RepID=A0A2P6VQI2_9CHLO|nr:DHH family isoform A [Micractinium conductrix]PSC76328.1 DHH family isoform B [Micractinium conductrix]|eukprot:PSC76327.1 DHH family isoform A [Micractinium conductrix]
MMLSDLKQRWNKEAVKKADLQVMKAVAFFLGAIIVREPRQLFMTTNNPSVDASTNECLFHSATGELVFRVQNQNGFFKSSKTVSDGAGRVLLVAKKNPISLAKWSITAPASGAVVAKTRTIAGMVKYGCEVMLPSRGSGPTFMVMPDASLQRVMMWQVNDKNVPDTPMCEAAYGSNVVMGLVSAAVNDWSYSLALDPGADAALVACMLCIYTDLVTWNALGGAFGMN